MEASRVKAYVDSNKIRRLQMQRRLAWVTLFSVAIVVSALYYARKIHARKSELRRNSLTERCIWQGTHPTSAPSQTR